MRAIQITQLEGPEAIEFNEVDDPVVTNPDKEVLIQVKAAGVAFPELLQTRGQYQMKPDLPFIPGAEVSGEVLDAPESTGLVPGDRVAALCLLGGFAEKVTARADLTFKLPDNISFEQGAAFLFNYCTCQFALRRRGAMSSEDTVLVHGAAGGIGTSAIQIAKAFGAREVIGVTSTEEKAEIARAAGADRVVNSENFLEELGRSSVDIVVDPVGGDRFTDSLRALKPEGRLLVIGFTAGSIPEVKVNRLLLNNISVVGVGWGAFGLNKPGFIAEQFADMEEHLAAGRLVPPLGPVFDLAEASKALQVLETRTATGKVVLRA
ncbi:NADPH:quinone oxidoreductase family protein [Auritidibacter sp. NML100628]|uniref:NADPH:quinone oxidoreductase family protein n=1 Tax=Auritidibacter sp. NML100628 TaxID=2170742 RepID=UPI000D7287F2|nr:NADPH:quinone oxidoreductase family protein [Auritidibacter sp. NML100628]PXA76538.1 NADPH:quinone oxidoreductase [Auritidibacter sp. NML100628]